jgi:hypothetical protein
MYVWTWCHDDWNDDDQKGMYLLIYLLQSKNEVESKYLSYERNCLKTMWLMAHV